MRGMNKHSALGNGSTNGQINEQTKLNTYSFTTSKSPASHTASTSAAKSYHSYMCRDMKTKVRRLLI